MGETPKKVFNVGGLGVDLIKNTNLLSKEELEKRIGFKLKNKNLSVTFHPVTLDFSSAKKQFEQLLIALKKYIKKYDGTIVFTKPNSDTGGRIIIALLEEFVKAFPNNCIAFTSMGQLNYLSLLQYVDAIVGNSSSGLLEAPSFKIGTINIGDRQSGRIIPDSLIQTDPNGIDIFESIEKLYSSDFKLKLKEIQNTSPIPPQNRRRSDLIDWQAMLHFPISKEDFSNIIQNNIFLAFADQVIYRFSKTQDTLGAKLFKAFLNYQGEDTARPFLDILNSLEKISILQTAEWFQLREIRNEIAHDYENNQQIGCSLLNGIYLHREELKKIIQSFQEYTV